MPSDNVGDFWPKCPQEWSPSAAIATARTMEASHGSREAARARALEYRQAYWPKAWGFRHWTLVSELLEGVRTEAELLALERPAAGWPTHPTHMVADAETPPPANALERLADDLQTAMASLRDGIPEPPTAPQSEPGLGAEVGDGPGKWRRWWEETTKGPSALDASLRTKPVRVELPAASEPEQGSLF